MDLAKLQMTLLVLAAACLLFRRTSLYAATSYLISASVISILWISRFPHGWDQEVYCTSQRILNMGLDPYITETFLQVTGVPSNLTFAYPPLAAYFFAPLCLMQSIFFPLFFLGLLAVVIFLFRNPHLENNLYLGALIFTGFAGFQWCFLTGNIGAVELFLLVLPLYLFSKKRFALMGACLGLLGFIKIHFLFYVPLVFFIKPARQKELLTPFFSGLIGTFSILQIFSLAIFPGLFSSFAERTWSFLPFLGGMPSETGAGWHNPTLPLAVHAWASRHLPGYGTGAVVLALLLVFLLRLLRDYSRWNEKEPLKVLSFGILVFSLAFPRLKPYSLIIATLPLYLVTMGFSWKGRSWILFLGCLLPQILFLNYLPGIFTGSLHFVGGVLSPFVEIYQTMCLLLSVVFVYFMERRMGGKRLSS